MSTNLLKVSSQGVRDYPISSNKKPTNEDIDDVYDHPGDNTSDYDTKKEVIVDEKAKNK